MNSLPEGCSINYEVTVVVHDINNEEFLAWWQDIGGEVKETTYYNFNSISTVRYGAGRWSHKSAGNPDCLIRFRGEDADVALMMLLKFDQLVVRHNIQQVEQLKEAHND